MKYKWRGGIVGSMKLEPRAMKLKEENEKLSEKLLDIENKGDLEK